MRRIMFAHLERFVRRRVLALVRRTGNLWLTIALHALYNGLQLAALALWPRALVL